MSYNHQGNLTCCQCLLLLPDKVWDYNVCIILFKRKSMGL
jgi:hypothetical protein